MAEQVPQSEAQAEVTLPIDIKTILKAIFQKKWWLIIIAVVAIGVGVGAAIMLGTQEFEAITVLYYQPVASALSDQFIVHQTLDSDTSLSYQQGAQLTTRDDSSMTLGTLVNMVELVPNFEQLRTEMGLEMTLEQIGGAIRVDSSGNTNLMFIYAKSEDREMAALLANSIRDIFLKNITKITMTELEDQLGNLNVQIASIDIELEENIKAFDDFLTKHELNNVDLLNTPYAEEYLKVQLDLENDLSMMRVYAMEMDQVDKTILETKNLLTKQSEEESGSVTQDDISVQILLVQEQIDEIRSKEVNSIMIQQEEDLYRIAQEAYANGEISRAELTTAQYQYELAIARYADTTDIDYLNSLIDDLRDRDVIGSAESLSFSDYLYDLQLKRVDAEINLLTAQETYKTHLRIQEELEKTLTNFPAKQQQYITLNGAITSLRAERRGLEKMLAQTTIAIEQKYSDFMIVSDAIPPIYPSGSNKQMLAIAFAFLIGAFGYAFILLQVFFDKRLRSVGEASLRLKEQVLTALPATRRSKQVIPSGDKESIFIEKFRMLARPLRKQFPQQGATFLITSSADSEGKTLVAINLASVFGRQDERVIIIEGQIRKSIDEKMYSEILFEEEKEPPYGLGEYLSYTADGLEEIVYHTQLPGVDIIPIRHEAVVPDLLQSKRMGELIDEIKAKYSIIIIESPPVENSVDAEVLTQYCDSVIYVVSSSAKAKVPVIKDSIKRIKDTHTHFSGIILTDVLKTFL